MSKREERFCLTNYVSSNFFSSLTVAKLRRIKYFDYHFVYDLEILISPNDPVLFKKETGIDLVEDYVFNSRRLKYVKKVGSGPNLLKELNKLKTTFKWSYKDYEWLSKIYLDVLEGNNDI